MQQQGIEGLEHFALAANLDTDKKHSLLNSLHTRGKRVVAEITLPARLIEEVMHTTGTALFAQRQLSNMGSLLSARSATARTMPTRITAHVHCLRPGCGQRGGIVCGLQPRGTEGQRRLLPLDHDPVADRCHLRRRHRPAHATRVPGGARCVRPGQGPEVRGDRRGHRAVRRTFARARRSWPTSGFPATRRSGGIAPDGRAISAASARPSGSR